MNLKSVAASSQMSGQVTRSNKEVYIEKLDKITKVKLLEIKSRQEKLLSNKYQLAKLPDKGKRIQDFYEKILNELASRDEIENAANLFSAMNIAATGKEKLNNLEWTGSCNKENVIEYVDSDDDETDPIKILAQSTQIHKRIKEIKPEPSLITVEDLKEIESFQKIPNINSNQVDNQKSSFDSDCATVLSKVNSNSVESLNSSSQSIELDHHALYLISKSNDNQPIKEKFMPYKTTKTDVHRPDKEKLRKLPKNWEITAATPPAIINSGTKLLSLQDSMEIQNQYKIKLKALQEQQANERLAAKGSQSIQMSLPADSVRLSCKSFNVYRHTENSTLDSDDENNDENVNSLKSDFDEVEDYEDDDEKGVGVRMKIS